MVVMAHVFVTLCCDHVSLWRQGEEEEDAEEKEREKEKEAAAKAATQSQASAGAGHGGPIIGTDVELPVGFERPVIIHRAILGSVERMFAILLEHTAGKWCVSTGW